MRLLVITSVIHYEWQGSVSSYGPYAREIDIWADLFSEVGIAAPLRREPSSGDCSPFTRENITILPQTEAGGAGFIAKLKLILKVPGLVWSLSKAIRDYDAVHVRCPGNLGLLGVLIAPLFSRRIVAKFAGQWSGYPGEPLTVRLQRWLLGSRYWTGPVTVYGKWEGQRPHVISFFTSTMTRQQVERAADAAGRKRAKSPLKILFVGRLAAGKNVDILIDAVSTLKNRGSALSCLIVGEGAEQTRLENMTCERGISDLIRFTGGLAYERVLDHMAQSDVLVLASDTEGWPKAIAEGMAHGLICIGADRGFVPTMLAEGRGLIVPVRDVGKLAEQLADIAADPERFELMRSRAAQWARHYSIEGLRESLRQLLVAQWDLPPAPLSTGSHAGSEGAVL